MPRPPRGFWPIDRHPEDRGRGRDDFSDGGQSPHLGDDHAEADRRHRAARAARDPPPARRPGAPQTLPRMALRRSIRRPPRNSAGARPSLVPRRSWTTTVTWVDSPPRPRRRCEGLDIGADTRRDADHLWRQDRPEAFELCLPHVRDDDGPPPPLPRRSSTGSDRAVIVRMRYHSPTLNYVERRTAEGR